MDDLDLAGLRAIKDPLERAKRAHDLAPVLEGIRDEAIAQADAIGHSRTDIGKALGLSRARVSQILSGGPGPERAFWGADSGQLTVAVGGKTEAPKKGAGPAGPVVAVEDVAAYDALREAAGAVGIRTHYEVIPPPGLVDLNRAGLVVICGPRLSPLVAQILASDRAVSFGHDDYSWYLEDRRAGRQFRSPMDNGTPADVAYLGRLPRPDGRGMFLYVAGIHAVGAAGVIHWLSGHLDEAWRAVRDHRFSALIRCEFDPDTREVSGSELVAGPYETA